MTMNISIDLLLTRTSFYTFFSICVLLKLIIFIDSVLQIDLNLVFAQSVIFVVLDQLVTLILIIFLITVVVCDVSGARLRNYEQVVIIELEFGLWRQEHNIFLFFAEIHFFRVEVIPCTVEIGTFKFFYFIVSCSFNNIVPVMMLVTNFVLEKWTFLIGFLEGSFNCILHRLVSQSRNL